MTTAACQRLDRDAPLPMFVASVAILLFLAGEIHFSHGTMFAPLLWGCHIGLAVLWPLFLLEAAVHAAVGTARWKQHLGYALCPPLRLGARDATTGQRVWLPRLGWIVVDLGLQVRMERSLNVPMLLIAMGVIPLLALDYYQPDHHPLVHQVNDRVSQPWAAYIPRVIVDKIPTALAWARLPAVRMATRIGEALIWTAFALEFALMISIVDRKLRYCRQHWIDLLVIVLPLVAFLRSLRLARLARLNQVGRFTRLYRLRGSVVRAQRGMVVASVVDRTLIRNPRRQLERLKEALAEKEHEAETLRTRIRDLEAHLERRGGPGRNAA